ncbi:caspase family protein, partial [Salmonella sp. s51228]|uniref:caspase family protein n=1 Tax=Salmonella sp. s51228 TaxID=3159652 RepID=UPI0039808EC2
SIQLNARIEPAHSEYELGSTVKINLPPMSDFLIAHSTATGYVSLRSKTEGTGYISELCDLFTTGHKKYDLMTILTQVNNGVAAKSTEQGLKQMPAPVSYLRGSIHIP